MVIDEAHERSVFTDILIGLLSRIVPLREKVYYSAWVGQVQSHSYSNAEWESAQAGDHVSNTPCGRFH